MDLGVEKTDWIQLLSALNLNIEKINGKLNIYYYHTVIVVYIDTMKTTFYFNYDLYNQTFKKWKKGKL